MYSFLKAKIVPIWTTHPPQHIFQIREQKVTRTAHQSFSLCTKFTNPQNPAEVSARIPRKCCKKAGLRKNIVQISSGSLNLATAAASTSSRPGEYKLSRKFDNVLSNNCQNMQIST